MELKISTFIIAMPRKRHDHLAYGELFSIIRVEFTALSHPFEVWSTDLCFFLVGRLTNFFDFKLICPYAGWAEDFVYVALELDPE